MCEYFAATACWNLTWGRFTSTKSLLSLGFCPSQHSPDFISCSLEGLCACVLSPWQMGLDPSASMEELLSMGGGLTSDVLHHSNADVTAHINFRISLLLSRK